MNKELHKECAAAARVRYLILLLCSFQFHGPRLRIHVLLLTLVILLLYLSAAMRTLLLFFFLCTILPLVHNYRRVLIIWMANRNQFYELYYSSSFCKSPTLAAKATLMYAVFAFVLLARMFVPRHDVRALRCSSTCVPQKSVRCFLHRRASC